MASAARTFHAARRVTIHWQRRLLRPRTLMLFRLTPICLLVLTSFPWQLAAQRQVPDQAPDIYAPAASDQERMAGLFSERVRANIEGYLEHTDTARLAYPFEHRSATGVDPTTAEGAGLFLLAASESYDYSDDAQLKAVMERMARALMKAQEKDGYMGIYSAGARWGRGDLLTQAGVLLGFVAYWRSTDDDDAEGAARRMADLFITNFGARKGPAEAAVLLPGMAELYRATGDARYLHFCRSLVSVETGDSPGTLVTTLRGYGLMELFRITGDAQYLRTAKLIWQKSQAEHPSVTGVPGSSEHVDSCTTLAWFQLTLDLLRLTGQAEYASSLELTIYNGLLAAQQSSTGFIDASVPLSGQKHFGHDADVCSAAAAVGIAELPDMAWGRYGYGIAIVGYVPGRASVRLRRRTSVQLYAEGNYPTSGSLLLHVEPSHDVHFPLRLFVPNWTHKFTVDVGATHVTGTPGQFLVVNREWKRGDTVRISIDLTASVVADPAAANRVAVRRGPQLLALAKPLNANVHDLSTVSISTSAANTLKLEENVTLPTTSGAQIYSIIGSESGAPVKLLLVPFCDATDYRVWLQPFGT